MSLGVRVAAYVPKFEVFDSCFEKILEPLDPAIIVANLPPTSLGAAIRDMFAT